jgi:hypothetical protein
LMSSYTASSEAWITLPNGAKASAVSGSGVSSRISLPPLRPGHCRTGAQTLACSIEGAFD